MSYSLDKIYSEVGRDDKVAVLTFYPTSKSSELYGETLTVLFYFDAFEREKYEKRYSDKIDEGKTGNIRANYLGYELPKENIKLLNKTGVDSKDIQQIFAGWSNGNLFHTKTQRKITTLEIPFQRQPKGGDYNWMYGFMNTLRCEFFEDEKDRYLAMKIFFEQDKLSEEEKKYAYTDNTLKETIEYHLLDIKFETEIITPEEEERWKVLAQKVLNENAEILKQELQNSGTDIVKLYTQNPGLCKHLINGIRKFIPRRLNGHAGKKPIFLDWKGYLHVFIRHVEEFKVNKSFENKSKFFWHPKDVEVVIEKVIGNVDEEIQQFFINKPGQRFSKYGAQSLYFEGDYYTFHIEPNGRLSTFHRSDKNLV